MMDAAPNAPRAGEDARGMAEQVRAFDWASTPLGPASAWPQSLHTTLSVVLNSRFPMFLAWGRSLTYFYNDACRPIRGDRPEALGRPLPDVWADAWPTAEPIVKRALGGEASYFEDFSLTIDRHGYPEKTWWTFSYSPVTGETGEVCGLLCIVHETTNEIHARAALSAERERLARFFDQAPSFIAILSGPNHVYEVVNEALRRLAPGREVLGKPVRDAFPELEDQGVFEVLDEVYRSGRPHVETGLKILLADAGGTLREHYLDLIYQPITIEGPAVTGIFVEGHDVTDRVAAAAAIRDREERLRFAVDAGRMATWEIDVVSGVFAPSPGLLAMLGLPPDGSLSLADLKARSPPGELDRAAAAFREARERKDRFFEVEFRHVRADDGRIRWLLVRGCTDFVAAGGTQRCFGVLMDLTERKEAEERLLLLTREVDHRANNLLAAVQSVVNLTRAEDIASFRERVRGRIGALAQAHRLLAESRWTGAGLARVVAEELEPYGEGHVRIEGPDARLSPPVAQALAIALHELATNAAKYGSLSTPDGLTRVTWSPPDAQRLVHLTWQETGGPPLSAPPRAGFGMTLLQRAFAGQPGADVELDWRPVGLYCTLSFPVL